MMAYALSKANPGTIGNHGAQAASVMVVRAPGRKNAGDESSPSGL